ncbi:MAG: TlpA disulfide reductase family protein [Candidatus Pseudobacter hemicellulosilyticus]|uniref:TlpA disulfide reductase family protein n=1 Tax=Candidatus Pseudobacter hemicellulosilyticus TaxID=3121375 RepID=A0AAJ5WUT4_9BACT|nr:MAG: TlpA disulfide reductase family protein [Pseudobacter sp.]
MHSIRMNGLCILLMCLSLKLSAQKQVVVAGVLDPGVAYDTIILHVIPLYAFHSADIYNQSNVVKSFSAVPVNGRFRIEFTGADHPVYIKVYRSAKREDFFNLLLDSASTGLLMVSPGDSLHISFHKQNRVYSGVGAAKNNCMAELSALVDTARSPKGVVALSPEFFAYENASLKAQMNILNKYRSLMTRPEAEQLEADIIGDATMSRFAYHFRDLDSKQLEYYKQVLRRIPVSQLNTPAAINSRSFASGIYRQVLTNYYYDTLIHATPAKDLYTHFTQNFTGLLRDRLVTCLLKAMSAKSNFSETDTRDALTYVQHPESRTLLESQYHTYRKGSPVINFVFRDSLNRPVQLSDLKGRVVLIDMWFTGCGGCVQVAKALPKVEELFRDRKDVVFVSISIDREIETWKKSIRPEGDKYYPGSTDRYTHYTTASTHYWYTSGQGTNNDFIQTYVPGGSYPHLLLLDKRGRVYSAAPPRPDVDADALVKLINQAADNSL